MTEWWTPEQAGWVGAGIGIAGGVLGAGCGVVMPLVVGGRAPEWLRRGVFAAWYAAIAVGAGLLVTGFYASWAGQPWHVRHPVTLAGMILFPLSAGLVTLAWMLGSLRRAHREDPTRQADGGGMVAMQAWMHTSPRAWEVMIDHWGPGGRCRRWLLGVLGVYVVIGVGLGVMQSGLPSPMDSGPARVRLVGSAWFLMALGAFTLAVILVGLSVQVKRLRARLEERQMAAAELRRG